MCIHSFKGPVACISPFRSRVWVYKSGKSRFENYVLLSIFWGRLRCKFTFFETCVHETYIRGLTVSPQHLQLYLVHPRKLNLYDKRMVIVLRILPGSFYNRTQNHLKTKMLFKTFDFILTHPRPEKCYLPIKDYFDRNQVHKRFIRRRAL